MLSLLLALHLLPGPVPTPDTTRYLIVTKVSSLVDLSAVGQAVTTITMTTSAYVTVALSDTAGGRLAHVVVDSSTFDAGQYTDQMPAAMTTDARRRFSTCTS